LSTIFFIEHWPQPVQFENHFFIWAALLQNKACMSARKGWKQINTLAGMSSSRVRTDSPHALDLSSPHSRQRWFHLFLQHARDMHKTTTTTKTSLFPHILNLVLEICVESSCLQQQGLLVGFISMFPTSYVIVGCWLVSERNFNNTKSANVVLEINMCIYIYIYIMFFLVQMLRFWNIKNRCEHTISSIDNYSNDSPSITHHNTTHILFLVSTSYIYVVK